MKHIANGLIPDGYFGDMRKVEFHFHPESGKTIVKYYVDKNSTDQCSFIHQNPQALSAKEAFWLLQNHPSNKNIMFLEEPKKENKSCGIED